MITLRKITWENFEDCLRLKLESQQQEYVASNGYSLAEAYALTNHPSYVPMPLAIYVGEEMVGFLMTIYQPMDPNDPDDDEDIFYLARLMIDQGHQGKGYAKAAVFQLIQLMKSKPWGPASAIILSLDPSNTRAEQLYRSLGFVEVGQEDEDGDRLWRLDI